MWRIQNLQIYKPKKKNVKNLEHRMYVGVLVLMLHATCYSLAIASIVFVELGSVTGQHFANTQHVKI